LPAYLKVTRVTMEGLTSRIPCAIIVKYLENGSHEQPKYTKSGP